MEPAGMPRVRARGASDPATARGEAMKLWELFNEEVPGIVFWPVMIVVLAILVPLALSIR